MRKRRAQGQQAAASGAFSWVVFYAFRSLFWRGLDNLSVRGKVILQPQGKEFFT